MQVVGGSNPLAPTNKIKSTSYRNNFKFLRAPSGPSCSTFQSSSCDSHHPENRVDIGFAGDVCICHRAANAYLRGMQVVAKRAVSDDRSNLNVFNELRRFLKSSNFSSKFDCGTFAGQLPRLRGCRNVATLNDKNLRGTKLKSSDLSICLRHGLRWSMVHDINPAVVAESAGR